MTADQRPSPDTPAGKAPDTSREVFHANLARAETTRDRMLDELRTALAERGGWHEWELTWRQTDRDDDHQILTEREIHSARGRDKDQMTPVFDLWCMKKNGHGQVTDEARFTDVAEALAWTEAPRSESTTWQRAAEEENRRWDRRNRVDLGGLIGERVDAGRNGKDQWFTVVEFEGIGRVRITDLGPRRWRIALARRTRVVAPREDQHPGTAIRAAIEELHRATPDAAT